MESKRHLEGSHCHPPPRRFASLARSGIPDVLVVSGHLLCFRRVPSLLFPCFQSCIPFPLPVDLLL